MATFLLKGLRYIKCYSELVFGDRPDTLEGAIDYCGPPNSDGVDLCPLRLPTNPWTLPTSAFCSCLEGF
jgi:hypothetical protein